MTVISPETRMMGLPYGEEIMIVGRTKWTQCMSVTDRRTDRITITKTVQRRAPHGKNCKIWTKNSQTFGENVRKFQGGGLTHTVYDYRSVRCSQHLFNKNNNAQLSDRKRSFHFYSPGVVRCSHAAARNVRAVLYDPPLLLLLILHYAIR